MKRKNIKDCPSFKSTQNTEAIHNNPLTANCSYCLYFSSNNCRFETANDFEPDINLI